MIEKIIHVQSGENLAALLKAFPLAEVGTLMGDPGKDSWRVKIQIEEPEVVLVDKPLEEPEEEAPPRKESRAYRLRVQDDVGRRWVVMDSQRMLEGLVDESEVRVILRWRDLQEHHESQSILKLKGIHQRQDFLSAWNSLRDEGELPRRWKSLIT